MLLGVIKVLLDVRKVLLGLIKVLLGVRKVSHFCGQRHKSPLSLRAPLPHHTLGVSPLSDGAASAGATGAAHTTHVKRPPTGPTRIVCDEGAAAMPDYSTSAMSRNPRPHPP